MTSFGPSPGVIVFRNPIIAPSFVDLIRRGTTRSPTATRPSTPSSIAGRTSRPEGPACSTEAAAPQCGMGGLGSRCTDRSTG